jgi:hypothetical protein
LYFPILRGKKFELAALRELSPLIAESKNVVPVIEPVEASKWLPGALKSLIEADATFCLIVNPQVVKVDLAALRNSRLAIVGSYNNCVPTLYLDSTTAPQLVDKFVKAVPGKRAYFLVTDPPTPTVSAATASAPHFVLFRNPSVSSVVRNQFDPAVCVDVTDPFPRKAKNADYAGAPDVFFSEKHLTTPNSCYTHFGDYSIVGDHFAERGGPAYAVALHHIYQSTTKGDALHIHHFVSTSNSTTADRPGKFMEALTNLVKVAPTLGAINQTPVVATYLDLHTRRHFPELGTAKKLGIMHHIQLMSRIV